MENFGHPIFDKESGALCHMILSVIGSCTVLILCTVIQDVNLKYPEEKKIKEKEG